MKLKLNRSKLATVDQNKQTTQTLKETNHRVSLKMLGKAVGLE